MTTYTDNLKSAAHHTTIALRCLRDAQAKGATALHRAAVLPMIKQIVELDAQVYDLACAAAEPCQESPPHGAKTAAFALRTARESLLLVPAHRLDGYQLATTIAAGDRALMALEPARPVPPPPREFTA